MKYELKPFTVSRAKWLRGRGADSALLSDGRMCCLGFAHVTAGVPERDIKGVSMPADADPKCHVRGLVVDDEDYVRDSRLSKDAADINDDKDIDDDERELRLTALFREHGIAVEFAP